MISTRPMKYQLEFCHPNTYASYVRAIKSGATVSRIGFLGVESLRLFVSVCKGHTELEVYQKTGNSWAVYSKRLQLKTPDESRMCHSAQEFEGELATIFFKAFPRTEETFYENLPSHQEVIAKLQSDPTRSYIEQLMLIYTWDDDTSIDDADGCVTITCDDGTVCIPFDYTSGDATLQMYRAKFHSEEPLASAFNFCCERVESWLSSLRSITLCGVLNRIDNFVK